MYVIGRHGIPNQGHYMLLILKLEEGRFINGQYRTYPYPVAYTCGIIYEKDKRGNPMATLLMDNPPSVPIGSFKSFGPGPKYQVGELVGPFGDDDWLVKITLIETGEQIEYRLSHLLEDPEAE
jgi:hypothetical protein